MLSVFVVTLGLCASGCGESTKTADPKVTADPSKPAAQQQSGQKSKSE